MTTLRYVGPSDPAETSGVVSEVDAQTIFASGAVSTDSVSALVKSRAAGYVTQQMLEDLPFSPGSGSTPTSTTLPTNANYYKQQLNGLPGQLPICLPLSWGGAPTSIPPIPSGLGAGGVPYTGTGVGGSSTPPAAPPAGGYAVNANYASVPVGSSGPYGGYGTGYAGSYGSGGISSIISTYTPPGSSTGGAGGTSSGGAGAGATSGGVGTSAPTMTSPQLLSALYDVSANDTTVSDILNPILSDLGALTSQIAPSSTGIASAVSASSQFATTLGQMAAKLTTEYAQALTGGQATLTGPVTSSTLTDLLAAAHQTATAPPTVTLGVATLDGTGKVPSAQMPAFGTGWTLGPFLPVSVQSTVSSTDGTPVRLADWHISSANPAVLGLDTQQVPVCYATVMVTTVNCWSRPVVEFRASPSQVGYAQQTTIARGVGSTWTVGAQSVSVSPVPAGTGTALSGDALNPSSSIMPYTTTRSAGPFVNSAALTSLNLSAGQTFGNVGMNGWRDVWITAWLYDANAQPVATASTQSLVSNFVFLIQVPTALQAQQGTG